jgi:hypothetical protein
MSNTFWSTPNEGMAIMAGQMLLVRALAAELDRLGKLNDALLRRVEVEATTNAKNSDFVSETDGTMQIHLMDYSIGAIRDGIKFLRATRNSGTLQ